MSGRAPEYSSLRRPASRRISTEQSMRLERITEGDNAPPIPPRSVFRNSESSLSLPQSITVTPPQPSYAYQPKSSMDTDKTMRTAPPAYECVPEPVVVEDQEDGRKPFEGEKLAAYRRAGGYRRPTRGGWKRFALIGLVALLLIGLIIGLAVGLTVGRRKSGGSSTSGPAPQNETQEQPFPLGQYSMVTALRTVDTNCTSNAETWACYPYNTYNAADSSTFTSSRTTFDWVIGNTSSTYATNTTGTTPDEGIPANLTITSTNNPLSISFPEQQLTYISPASNATAMRYAFTFTMSKSFIPPVSLANDNRQSQCFFNQTTFTGTLYLSAAQNYPAQETPALGGGLLWPYAIEVAQSSGGGQDTPACYEYQNGAIGARISTNSLTPQAAGQQCLCDYRNF